MQNVISFPRTKQDHMEKRPYKNIAFIDGQNLHMNTAKRNPGPWIIDLARFYTYLARKYSVDKAYYVLGHAQDENTDLYTEIRHAGFNLLFRLHNPSMIGKKKGNVDSDIIFHTMKLLYKRERFDKIVLVSGDGDYKLLIDFLIEEQKFAKILFPDRRYRSSLYKSLTNNYFSYLDDAGIRNKIERK